jgi:uncharacterized protein with PIN domain
MRRKLRCPRCAADLHWASTLIECEQWPVKVDVIETDTYYCAACNTFWDVQFDHDGGWLRQRAVA